MRVLYATILAAAMLAAGCGGGDEPAALPLPDAGIETVESTDSGVSDSAVVIDVQAPGPSAAADGVAGAQAGTNPPLTTAPIANPPPKFSLSGADATTPTTWASTVTTAPATTSTTIAATTAPAAPTAASGSVVEFRIRSGTQAGAWNSYENRVRLQVGQVLRVYNDDVVAHTVHTDGTPFQHGPTIQPGSYADHPVLGTYTPDPSRSAVYEHDAGQAAPFWVEATAAPAPTTAPPTTAPPTTAPPTTAPPTTSAPNSSDGGELAAAEAESLRLLNELRSRVGARTVTHTDGEMHRFARSWALEMRNTGFRHSDARWSENIVWYSDETMTPQQAAAKLHDMWVNSPGHYRNMTNTNWSVVGIGMWHDGTGWWGVHVFR